MATIKLKGGNVVLKNGKVSCNCCQSCNCQNRPVEKYKFISTNFASIGYQDTNQQCFESYPNDPDPTIYYAFATLSNGGAMTLIWRNCSGTNWMNWEVTLYNFSGSVPLQCSNMVAFTNSLDPTGTHQFYPIGQGCNGWNVTIGLDI